MSTSHLNLKWTVEHTDAILQAARLRYSAYEICYQVAFQFDISATPDEIIKICDGAGVFVHSKRRVS